MTSLRQVGESVLDHLPEILKHWQTSQTGDSGHFGLDEVICSLVAEALAEGCEVGATLNKVRAAAKHGEHRRKMGFGEQVLLWDYYLLRQSLWQIIERYHGGTSAAVQAIARLDSGITLAVTASFRGYHKVAFETRGEWPQAITALADQPRV